MYTYKLLLLFVFYCVFCEAIPGDLSKKKCKEYDEKTSFTDDYSPVFSVDEPVPIKESNCYLKPTFVSGGVDAEKGEFPHMALIGYKKDNKLDWACGGSLISEEYILTAAHCINVTKGTIVVHLGALKFDDNKNVQKFEISTHMRHPTYKRGKRYDDIALLKLPSKAEFNEIVRPACLQTGDEENEEFMITGWGQLSARNYTLSKVLQKTTIDRFTNKECNEWYGSIVTTGIKEDSMICAGGRKNNTDTCQGDSGGPLQVKNPNTSCLYSIVGVTSFGMKECGVTGVPAVYTRVSHYLDWIEKIVWGSETNK